MALRISTGLKNGMLATGSYKALVESTTGFLIDIYSGSRPASPDLAATGTKLLTLSANGAGDGLHLDDAAAAGKIAKAAAETWKGNGLANGTAGYYRKRLVSDSGTNDSTTAIRVDGTIATSGADMNLTNTVIAEGAPYIVSSASFNIPSA